MEFATLEKVDRTAVVTLARGKVNALNEQFLKELIALFTSLGSDEGVDAVVLTGRGSFFSFGFDVPEGASFERERFGAFLRDFCRVYQEMFLFPKPLVAALNGHAVAGGCMLAVSCDFRVMATGKVMMGLNEINFGASIFTGMEAVLRRNLGYLRAREVLYLGNFYLPEDALAAGLVDRLVEPEKLMEEALALAVELGKKPRAAFRALKLLMNGRIAEKYFPLDDESVERFMDIWYLPETQEMVKKIEIRS